MANTKQTERKYWIGVASLKHVLAAVGGGFCQLSHGKEASVRRLKVGDIILFYSPRTSMDGGDTLQAFSAAGRILDDEPYQVEQAANFKPFRRKIHYFKSKRAPIEPLTKTLTFTREYTNWGFAFRRGAFPIPQQDFLIIAEAMKIDSGVVAEP